MGLHHCSAPALEDLCPPPLSAGQSGASASSSANSHAWELKLPEVIASSPAHLPSASSEPRRGLGWFLRAAMCCPSPPWAEAKEEMGIWQNYIVLSAFQLTDKPSGKLRKEQDTKTSWQEASGWVLAMEDHWGSRWAGRRQRGEEQEWWKAYQNWVHGTTLFQLPGPEGRSIPQRSHSTSLPSISSSCPAIQGPAREKSGEQLPACSWLPPQEAISSSHPAGKHTGEAAWFWKQKGVS